MYISHVEIDNFRNFRHLTLDLEQYSVIVGANKAGKSNLLAAIRLAIDPNLAHRDRLLDPSDIWMGDVNTDEPKIVTVIVEITLVNDEEKFLMTNVKAVTGTGNTARFLYRFPVTPPILIDDNNPTEEPNAPNNRDEQTKTLVSAKQYIWGAGPEGREEIVSNKLGKCLTFEVMNALRDVEGLLESWRRTPLNPLLTSLGIDDERLQEIAQNIQTEAEELRREEKVKDLVTRINRRSSNMVGPTFSTESDLKILTGEAEDLLKSMRLLSDRNLPVSKTSLGTQNVLYLALLLEEMSNRYAPDNPNKQQLILALEEPEAHIHPHMQRSIFKHFNGQRDLIKSLLVTTHSPHIVSVSPLKSIVLLKDAGKQQGSKAHWLREELDPQDVKDIERYLDVTRAELIFARGIIFVEGTAEQYLIPAFAKSIDVDLDHWGISVIAVDGNNFEPYARLVSPANLNIPFVILTDLDSQNTKGQSGWDRLKTLYFELTDGTPSRLEDLEVANIFTGPTTLEIDILPTCADMMLETYKEFGVGDIAQQHFEEQSRWACEGDEHAITFILGRIRDISKGRFAQRLAPKIETDSQYCPSHIEQCIRRISSLVENI